jgi:hypothetical protein
MLRQHLFIIQWLVRQALLLRMLMIMLLLFLFVLAVTVFGVLYWHFLLFLLHAYQSIYIISV